MKKVLVIGAHPDDEIIGLGATLARHIESGDEVSVLILTDGHGSRDQNTTAINERILALKNSCKVLGISNIQIEKFPDQALDTIALTSIVKSVEKYAKKINPDIVYFHHEGDLNMDHQIVHKACLTAFRPIGKNYPKRLYSYETFSSTEWGSLKESFLPNYFVDTTKYHKLKEKALECYHMELRDYPHPRSLKSIEICAQRWGSVIGVTYAEAFILIRGVD